MREKRGDGRDERGEMIEIKEMSKKEDRKENREKREGEENKAYEKERNGWRKGTMRAKIEHKEK